MASRAWAAKVESDRQRQAAQQELVSFAVFELIEAAGREAQRGIDALLNRPGAGPAPTDLTKQQIIEAKTLMQAQITAEAHWIPWRPRPTGPLALAPALETALVAGPIIAWRLWRVWREDGSLYLDSISRHCPWPYGVPLQANGAIGSHGGTGIYAMKRREDVSGEGYAPTMYARGHVLGEVALWGRVIEHENGYRATCAYPYRLHMEAPAPMPGFPRSAVNERLARALSAAYGCEVVT